MLKQDIFNLATLWPNYLAKVNEDSSSDAYKLIYQELPERLKQLNPNDNNLVVDSSGGTGRITSAPWFATFDKRITTKPTEGLYVVFLFSVDMSSVTLQLGLGTTQFTNFHGSGEKALALINSASSSVRQSLSGLIETKVFRRLKDRVRLGPSNLKTSSSNKLQKTYEQASIYHITYQLNDSSVSTLEEDYLDLLNLYQRAIDVGVIPEMESLLCQTIDFSSVKNSSEGVEVVNFKPRTRKHTQKNPKKESQAIYAWSSKGNTKLIGDLGEKIALDYERRRLIAAGRFDLADKIIHEEAEGSRPGWDISSFDEIGNAIQIEVKSSVSSTINSLVMTSNEWAAASDKRESYHLYLVTGVSKSGAKKIEILQNPFELNSSGEVELEVLSYHLKLSD
jgi:hypothetical protein